MVIFNLYMKMTTALGFAHRLRVVRSEGMSGQEKNMSSVARHGGRVQTSVRGRRLNEG